MARTVRRRRHGYTWRSGLLPAAANIGRYAMGRFFSRARGTKRVVGVKRKAAFSATRTKTKKAKTQIASEDVHSAISRNSVVMYVNPKAYKIKQLGMFKYTQSNYGLTINTHGMQQAFNVVSHGTREQLLGATLSPGVRPNYDQFHETAFAFNPYQAPTGSSDQSGNVVVPSGITALGLVGTGTSRKYDEDRIHLRSVYGEHIFSNQSSVACSLTLYWILNKKDNNAEPIGFMNDLLTKQSGYQAGATIPGASNTAGTPGEDNVTMNWPGVGFTHERNFFNHYKILRVRTITLAGGATHKLNFKIRYNTTFSRLNLLARPSSVIGFAGQTVHCIGIMKTMPVIGNPLGTKCATFGQTTLAWTTVDHYDWCTLTANRQYFNRYFSNVPNLGPLAGSYQQINEVDQIVPEAEG